MKERKEVQKATLEASGHMAQHGPSVSWTLICRSISQAALRAHAQSLQAGAVACGWEHGQRVSRAALSVVSLAGAARAT